MLIIGIVILLVGVVALEDNLQIAVMILAAICLLFGIVALSQSPELGKIKKVAKVYWPFQVVTNPDGTKFIIDQTGMTEGHEITFASLQSTDGIQLIESKETIERQLSDVPVILSNVLRSGFKNEEKNIINGLSNARDALDRVSEDAANLSLLPSLMSSSELLKMTETNVNGTTTLLDRSSETIRLLAGKTTSYSGESSDINEELGRFMQSISVGIDKYAHKLDGSLNVDIYNALLNYEMALSNLEYNFYCPTCNSEFLENVLNPDYSYDKNESHVRLIENTLLELVDKVDQKWKCNACNETTEEPIRRNKLDEDSLIPAYDRLMEEHHKERLAIYSHIADEKRKYQERADTEFHAVLRENRAQIDQVKSKLRSVSAEVNSEEVAIARLKEILIKYDQIAEHRSSEIDSEIRALKEQIASDTEHAKGDIQNVLNDIMKDIDEKSKQYAKMEAVEQRQRDKVQQEIQRNGKLLANLKKHELKKKGMLSKKEEKSMDERSS